MVSVGEDGGYVYAIARMYHSYAIVIEAPTRFRNIDLITNLQHQVKWSLTHDVSDAGGNALACRQRTYRVVAITFDGPILMVDDEVHWRLDKVTYSRLQLLSKLCLFKVVLYGMVLCSLRWSMGCWCVC